MERLVGKMRHLLMPARQWSLWSTPAHIVLLILYLVPLGIVLLEGAMSPTPMQNYRLLFEDPVYLNVLGTTFWIALIVTVACALVGVPFAHVIYSRKGWRKRVLLAAILLPFWTSLLVRTFSWMLLLQREGAINDLLRRLGLIEQPVSMVYNRFGVCVAMVYMLLPFFVLPLLAVMERVDKSVLFAAASLGASPRRVWFRVFLPMVSSGLYVGSGLVFILSLGFFITPALLGGRKDQTISMLIEQQVRQLGNEGFASALAGLLVGATMVSVGILVFSLRFRRGTGRWQPS